MTSTSELFHYNRRRHRFSFPGGGDVTHPSLAAKQPHRTSTICRSHHHNNRFRLSSRHHHPCSNSHLEHEEQDGTSSQSPLGNSNGISGRGSESDRLPGAVLLARERLLERLRGVSVSGNRNNSFTGIDYPLEIRNQRMEEILTRKHVPGLTQDALNCLQSESFSSENDDETSIAFRGCSICLEDIQNGSGALIRLHCAHTFHSTCLFPWLRICGACPNCRKPVHLNVSTN
uniref:probable E3 ubiquitin-protein ligase RHY1A n=1 Tax=Erigeron canadensis TaxID=72917 RepID=UPI001CB89DA3|nr:probable E3 ubiquitin-protein ligase RHY1A [Erigeron canadensis]